MQGLTQEKGQQTERVRNGRGRRQREAWQSEKNGLQRQRVQAAGSRNTGNNAFHIGPVPGPASERQCGRDREGDTEEEQA